MRNEPASLPPLVNPADPADLIQGLYVPGDLDGTTEDVAYSRPADTELLKALGLDRRTRWVERVTVRFDGVDPHLHPLMSAHTIVPIDAVAAPDTWHWRDLTFGSVLVTDALLRLQDTWLTSQPASIWDVEALSVPLSSVMHAVWITLTIQCTTKSCTASPSPGGLVIKAPASRVTLPDPLPEHVHDGRPTDAQTV